MKSSVSSSISLGLHYLHGKKVLHRDLKAANVFLMKYKDRNHPFFLVKIGDLGVAKLLETSTAFAQTIIGTPYYLSPELCADQPYREKSDCWALGILLYKVSYIISILSYLPVFCHLSTDYNCNKNLILIFLFSSS